MKRTILIAPFFNHESINNRPMMVAGVLSSFGPIEVITTDFDHQVKKKKDKISINENFIISYIKTLPYKSNKSFKRFLSHILFSFKTMIYYIKIRNNYDIIYLTLPLNFTAFMILLFKGNKIVIVDVIDIWPDVLPFNYRIKLLLFPLFYLWKKLYVYSIKSSDYLLTVSEHFFYESIKHFTKDKKHAKRIYIASKEIERISYEGSDIINIVYVGNIGHLYDFESLIEALSIPDLRNKYRLNIIGDGDKAKWLISELEKRKIDFTNFGCVYERKRLSEILSSSEIGFNGYVNTEATFSYKASTYFSAGLPIINSMHGDLFKLVEAKDLGYNYVGGDAQSLVKCLRSINMDRLRQMSENSRLFFKEELDQSKITDLMLQYFAPIFNS